MGLQAQYHPIRFPQTDYDHHYLTLNRMLLVQEISFQQKQTILTIIVVVNIIVSYWSNTITTLIVGIVGIQWSTDEIWTPYWSIIFTFESKNSIVGRNYIGIMWWSRGAI